MEIALGTSQGEVLCCVGSALADWDVMLDVEAAVGEALWGAAKLAAAFGSIDDRSFSSLEILARGIVCDCPTEPQDSESPDRP
jgi:hypothetical protein